MSQDRIANPQPTAQQLVADEALAFLSDSANVPRATSVPTVSHQHGEANSATCDTGQRSDAERAAPSAPTMHITHLPEQPPAPAIQAPTVDAARLQPNDSINSINKARHTQASGPRRVLPSLLRYIDHTLMQDTSTHDHPLHPNATCPVCYLQWDTPVPILSNSTGLPPVSIRTTFLPLSPCGHWMHYHCLIYLTTQSSNPDKDRCHICRTRLFEWEGITALTLATRTNLELQSYNASGYTHGSDREAYETECALIDELISQHFFATLSSLSKYGDGSPNLLATYYAVLDELEKGKRPQSLWLSWNTEVGFLLFGMLVYVKMRRYLVERHAMIVGTEGWGALEEGRVKLQEKILGEVHRN